MLDSFFCKLYHFSAASASFVAWHCISLVFVDSIQYNGSFRVCFYGACQDLAVSCILKLILNDKVHHRTYFTTVNMEAANVWKTNTLCGTVEQLR